LKELTPTFFPGNKRNAFIDNYNGKNLKIIGEEWITMCTWKGGIRGGVNRLFNPGKYCTVGSCCERKIGQKKKYYQL
jgi:hypothetical protein